MGIDVGELVGRMRVAEKLAQLGSVRVDDVADAEGAFSEPKAAAALAQGIGQVTRIAGSPRMTPRKAARLANDVQAFLARRTRLAIPALMHEECVCGFMADGAVIFPQAIGLASSWDPDLVSSIAGTIRRQIRQSGGHQGLSPVLDIAMDPRWGRIEETYGEDPCLVAAMAVAYVKGLQGGSLADGVMATLKHFAGHSFSEGGRNSAPVHAGPRFLRDVILHPFEAAVRLAHAQGVMNAYNEIDGVPCAASRGLLTETLREEWGFDGIVVSDYYAVERLHSLHGTARDKSEAAAQALRAGVDMELPRTDCYGAPLMDALNSGAVTMDAVDRAVTRILEVKARLGLFQKSVVDVDAADWDFDGPRDKLLAREAAEKSMVLLKNEGGLLPLAAGTGSLAVIGPNAASQLHLLGDYTYTGHGLGAETAATIVSVLDGIRAAAGEGVRVEYARGCGITDPSTADIAAAVEAARRADVAVLVAGSNSGVITAAAVDGEERDRAELGLPGVQARLVDEVVSTGTPVVLVLVNGRPLVIRGIAERVPAILEAWLPGEEGGTAVANILFGRCNPSGKLPVSLLSETGQVPYRYNLRRSSMGGYVFTENVPVFPFGHGLSYTRFAYADLSMRDRLSVEEKELEIRVRVANAGTVYGEEVVQLYVTDEHASVTRPAMELKGFRRVGLRPGEGRTVRFRLDLEMLSFYDGGMRRVVEPGAFAVRVGSSSADIRCEGRFVLEGGTRVIGTRAAFVTPSMVE